jgi:hypothetical protein
MSVPLKHEFTCANRPHSFDRDAVQIDLAASSFTRCRYSCVMPVVGLIIMLACHCLIVAALEEMAASMSFLSVKLQTKFARWV